VTEKQAKKQLTKMLQSFTPGSVLHLLADLHQEVADEARRNDEAAKAQRAHQVEHTLFVVGIGIDAVMPS
jgi:hypothetical protein